MLEKEDLVVRAGGGNRVPDVVERLVAGVRVERYVEHARIRVRLADLRVIELLRQALVRLLAKLARLVDHQSHDLLAHAAGVYGSAARFICMAKKWVLDTDTKGTGARMVPLDDVQKKAEPRAVPNPISPPKRKAPAPAKPKPQVVRATPLAPGQVRKKSNGEIGKVKAIDPRAGTATVTWLRDGRTSTVPISSVTRR